MTTPIPITDSQRKATADFHRRMEKLFRSMGRAADADSARKAAEKLEAEQANDEQAKEH